MFIEVLSSGNMLRVCDIIIHTDNEQGLYCMSSILIMQYIIQQISQSVSNNHLTLMSLLYVLTSTRASSGMYSKFCRV